MKSKTIQTNLFSQSSITSFFRSRHIENHRKIESLKCNLQPSGIRDITNTHNFNLKERSRSISRQEKNVKSSKSQLIRDNLNSLNIHCKSKINKQKVTLDSKILKIKSLNFDPLHTLHTNSCNLIQKTNDIEKNGSDEENKTLEVTLTKSSLHLEYFDSIEETLLLKDKTLPIFEENFCLNYKNRAAVVDWMIESFNGLEIQDETLFLAISIFDDYLAKFRHKLYTNSIWLVAIVSIFIASKYEEIYPPDFETKICKLNSSFSPKQIINLESSILGDLGYDVCYLTVWQLLELYSTKLTSGQYNKEFSLSCIRLILISLNQFKKVKISTLCFSILYLTWYFSIISNSNSLAINNPEIVYNNKSLFDSQFCKLILFPLLNQKQLMSESLIQIKKIMSQDNEYFVLLSEIREISRQIIFVSKEVKSEETQLKSLTNINSSIINYQYFDLHNQENPEEQVTFMDKQTPLFKSCIFSELIESIEYVMDRFDLFSM